MLFEARQEEERRRRSERANEICALIRGFRVKQPNLREIWSDLTGIRHEPPKVTDEDFGDLLRESEERAARARAKNGN